MIQLKLQLVIVVSYNYNDTIKITISNHCILQLLYFTIILEVAPPCMARLEVANCVANTQLKICVI